METDEEDFRKKRRKIIRAMYSLNKWGSNHILIKNLESGFPKHEMKRVKRVVIELIKDGILIVKPTIHGKAVSLNTQRKGEIDEIKESVNF